MIYYRFRGIFQLEVVLGLLKIEDYNGEGLNKGKLFELLLTGVTFVQDQNEDEIKNMDNIVFPREVNWFDEFMKNVPPNYDPYFTPGKEHHPVLEKFFSAVRRRFKSHTHDLSLYVTIGTKLDIYHHTDLFFYWHGVKLTIDLTTYPLGIGYVPRDNHIILSPEDIGLRTSDFENFEMSKYADFYDISFKIKDTIKYISRHFLTRKEKEKRRHKKMNVYSYSSVERGD